MCVFVLLVFLFLGSVSFSAVGCSSVCSSVVVLCVFSFRGCVPLSAVDGSFVNLSVVVLCVFFFLACLSLSLSSAGFSSLCWFLSVFCCGSLSVELCLLPSPSFCRNSLLFWSLSPISPVVDIFLVWVG